MEHETYRFAKEFQKNFEKEREKEIVPANLLNHQKQKLCATVHRHS